jgi:hypothetical protein
LHGVVSGDDGEDDDVVPNNLTEAALEGNIVSADIAELEGELIAFGGIVAILSGSGRKRNSRSWGKSGDNSWRRNLRWKSGGCICWWLDDGDDWLGWGDCGRSNNWWRCEGWDVEAERIDGWDVNIGW